MLPWFDGPLTDTKQSVALLPTPNSYKQNKKQKTKIIKKKHKTKCGFIF